MDGETTLGGLPGGLRQEQLAFLCFAAGIGWIGFHAWRRWDVQRRDPARHRVTARSDGYGIDPLDAPGRTPGRTPVPALGHGPGGAASTKDGTQPEAITGAMTAGEVEENAWGTAAPHVGRADTPHRPIG
ncbi:MAG: hypothetical protein ACK4QW_00230 [Alphaproteobacteria bacterium]